MMHEDEQVKKLKPECTCAAVYVLLNALLPVQAINLLSATQMQRPFYLASYRALVRDE